MIKKSTISMLLWILISVIFLSIILIPEPATCEATETNSDLPRVKLKLLDESQTSHVGPYDSGKVVFNGTVNVTCRSGAGVLVLLYSRDTWGSADIAPDTFLFSESGEKAFDVECFTRPREPVVHTGTVTISGRWYIPGEDLSGYAEPRVGVTGTINIAQFHRYSLMRQKAFYKVDPGGNELVELTIQNRGNGMDLFSIGIQNKEELLKNDFKVTLNQTLIEIPEHPSEFTIQFLVEVPTGEYWMSHQEIDIEVASIKGLENGVPPQTIEFIIRIEGEVFKDYGNYSISVLTLMLVILIALLWLRRFRKEMKKWITK